MAAARRLDERTCVPTDERFRDDPDDILFIS